MCYNYIYKLFQEGKLSEQKTDQRLPGAAGGEWLNDKGHGNLGGGGGVDGIVQYLLWEWLHGFMHLSELINLYWKGFIALM